MAENKNKEGSEKPKKTKVPTALKRDIQNRKKYAQNRSFKSEVRTAMNRFEKAFADKDSKENVSIRLNLINSLMDRGVKKGIFKKNKASRVKSGYAKRLNCSL